MRIISSGVRPVLRSLATHRGVTIIAVLTLALTIGLTTAVFTAAEGVRAVATIETVAVALLAMAPSTHDTVPAT